jgi:hypothetical protein
VWFEVQNFAEQNKIHHLPLGMQALAWVSSRTDLLPSTRLGYASALRSTARRMQITTPALDLYTAALAADGATTPTRQAVPATRDQVRALVQWALQERRDPRLATAVYLLHKTASRWDDMVHLRRKSMLAYNPERRQLVIQWARTKTNRAERKTVHTWTVVQEEFFSDMLELAANTINALPTPESFLTDLSTLQFVRLIQQCPQCKDLTAHSFKRGAADLLWRAAAEDRLEPRLIPLLLKHKWAMHDFPSSSVGYNPNHVQTALAMGTQQATRLL